MTDILGDSKYFIEEEDPESELGLSVVISMIRGSLLAKMCPLSSGSDSWAGREVSAREPGCILYCPSWRRGYKH